jgi:hypothetical protein
VVAGRTLFFFHAMFGDPQPLGRQINHLASLREAGFLGPQIVLTLLATADGMNEDLIGRLDLPQVRASMALLSAWFLATLVPQALGGTNEAVGGGRQTAIMAVFSELPLQGFDALLQTFDLSFELFGVFSQRVNGHDGLFEPFTQVLICLAGLLQFFVFALQPLA